MQAIGHVGLIFGISSLAMTHIIALDWTPIILGLIFCIPLVFELDAIAALNGMIRHDFQSVAKADETPSIDIIFSGYAAVRKLAVDTSKDLKYILPTTFIFIVMIFYLSVKDFRKSTKIEDFSEWHIFFICFYALSFVMIIALLAWPSILIERTHGRLRDRLLQGKHISSGDNKIDYRTACLWLDNDEIGIKFCGVLFDKKVLELIGGGVLAVVLIWYEFIYDRQSENVTFLGGSKCSQIMTAGPTGELTTRMWSCDADSELTKLRDFVKKMPQLWANVTAPIGN